MDWRMTWACTAAVMTVGCPEVVGRDGKLDRAMHEDAKALLQGSKCSADDYADLCGGDKKESQKCIEICGG